MEKSFVKKSLLIVLDLLIIIFFVLLVKFKTPVEVFSLLGSAFSVVPSTPITAEPEFSLLGSPTLININKTYSGNGVYPLSGASPIYGLSAYGHVELLSEDGFARIILVTDKGEKLVSEFYPLIFGDMQKDDFNICEETCALGGEIPKEIKIEIKNATLRLDALYIIDSYSKINKEIKGKGIGAYNKEIKSKQDKNKIKNINAMLSKKNKSWVAGETEVSALSYSEKKKLYGQSVFPAGFEYYIGGVFQTGNPSSNVKETTTTVSAPSAVTVSSYINNWDWRNRHGKNWITQIANQGSCGSCWAFAATGATEAITNLFFNQILNLNLSEQDVLSCSNGGTCNGGYPSTALTYITNTGIVDEVAFPYTAKDQVCTNKSVNPTQLIKISGKTDFGSTTYPKTEDALKKMLIEMGPISGGLSDWSHAMVLVGYKVVKEGDVFYYRGLNLARSWKTVSAGDPIIGKTVWIFKNSWGAGFGDQGYVYVETPITNINWTHSLRTPVTSLKSIYTVNCSDTDNDGYYWWGIGTKPNTCPISSSNQRDGDDSNANLGPINSYGNFIDESNSSIPVADFSSNKISLIQNGTVSFTDLSTNNPSSWSWTFEGGTPQVSTERNPIVTYNTVGVYDVILVASNASGSTTKTKTDYVSVTPIELYGNISISSNPLGATVYVDGINKGVTPIFISNIKIGSHNVKLSKSGYQTYTTTITVLDGQTSSLNPNLVQNKNKRK